VVEAERRVTVNASLSAMRKRSKRPVLGIEALGAPGSGYGDLADSAPGPEERAERSELVARAEAAVGALPESARAIVVLRDVEGMSTAEVAAVTGLTETAVKVRLFRARERLRAALTDTTVTPLARSRRASS